MQPEASAVIQQAVEMGWQECHEFQQREVQSPPPGEERSHAPGSA